MQNRYFTLVFTLVILVIALAGCSQQNDPEEVYWQYWEACSEGKFNEAALLLSENARETSRQLGACAFTHDAINTIEAQKGNPPRTFSQDPQVNVQEKAASIIWFDDQGNIATVILVLIEGEWKVTEATWSI
jgi:hypothetical protein